MVLFSLILGLRPYCALHLELVFEELVLLLLLIRLDERGWNDAFTDISVGCLRLRRTYVTSEIRYNVLKTINRSMSTALLVAKNAGNCKLQIF